MILYHTGDEAIGRMVDVAGGTPVGLTPSRESKGSTARLAITVFGGSRVELGSREYGEARELGRLLAAEGFVVCNGGYSGVMEAVHRGAKEVDGQTVGYTVDLLAGREVNQWADREERSATLFERLDRLTRDAAAFVALGGGIGTLLEVALVWNLAQLDVGRRQPIVLVGRGWRRVIQTMSDELQVQPRDLERICVVDSAEAAARLVCQLLM